MNRLYECRCPLLSVSPAEKDGLVSSASCDFIRLELAASDDSAPFRVSISEDAPAGAGDQLRSSVWLAAVTAAMRRNNVLSGMRLSVDFNGIGDGPSAGAVLCLAVLSALDNRPFPPDFAMTGTILPDGTIGCVGGVALKIRAAARAGIRRVCIPAFLRYEPQDDKSYVDLFAAGRKAGVSVFPVRSVDEAFAVAYGLAPEPIRYEKAQEVCARPAALDKMFVRVYLRLRDKLVSNLQRSQEENQKQHGANAEPPPGDSAFADSIRAAEGRFQAGFPAAAYETLDSASAEWNGLRRTCALLSKIRSPARKPALRDQCRRLLAFDAAKERLLDDFRKKYATDDFTPVCYRASLSESAAQVDSSDLVSVPFICDLFREITPRLSPDDLDRVPLKDILEATERIRTVINMINNISVLTEQNIADIPIRAALAAALPRLHANAAAAETEKLFFSAANATFSAFQSNMADSDAISQIGGQLYDIRITQDVSSRIHGRLDSLPRSAKTAYIRIVSLVQQAGYLAAACQLSAMNDPAYANNALILQYLIQSARNEAIVNLRECVAAGVPCLEAVLSFEMADSGQAADGGDDEKDRLAGTLKAYWFASLAAKALLMAFKPTPGAAPAAGRRRSLFSHGN